MLKETTRQLILEISGYPFFENMGSPNAEAYGTRCKSWGEAIRFAQSRPWENHCQTFSNRLNERCNSARLPKERAWNNIADEVNELLTPAITKINQLFLKKNEAWSLGGHVIFQIRSAVEEMEYGDIVEPCFFIPVLLPIYRAGFYCCGWDGDKIPRDQLGGEIEKVPAGRVRVF